MRWYPAVYSIVLLPFGVTGCARPSAAVPPADEVASVRVTVRKFAEPAEAKVPCKVTLTEPADVAEVIGWLERIDWSQKGADPAVISLPMPDGNITIVAKGGTTRSFGFYWDGGFLAGRFIREGT